MRGESHFNPLQLRDRRGKWTTDPEGIAVRVKARAPKRGLPLASAKTPIPPASLVQRALDAGATNRPNDSIWHGDAHWRNVATVGLEIGRRTPGFDPGFLVTFAMLHDTMRENEYEDPQHGHRAARMYERLMKQEGHTPDPELIHAFEGHTYTPNAKYHPNVNVGIAWDADRLNLWRVGVKPDNKFITTRAAKDPALHDLGQQVSRRQMNRQALPSWDDIVKRAHEIASGTAKPLALPKPGLPDKTPFKGRGDGKPKGHKSRQRVRA